MNNKNEFEKDSITLILFVLIIFNVSFGQTTFISETLFADSVLEDARYWDVADIDNDGYEDVVVIEQNIIPHRASYLRNNGNKTFTKTLIDTFFIGAATGLELGDIDNNGSVDIVVVINEINDPYLDYVVTKIFMNTNGTFTDTSLSFIYKGDRLEGSPTKLVDLDRDGDLDIVTGNVGFSPDDISARHNYYLHVAYNNGGSFSIKRKFDKYIYYTDGGLELNCLDLDNDGWIDILFKCPYNVFQLEYDSAVDSLVEVDTVVYNPPSYEELDLDVNGELDQIYIENSNLYVKYQVNGTYKTRHRISSAVTRCDFFDIDNDNDLDIIIENGTLYNNLLNMRLLYPNGDEELIIDSTYAIRWNYTSAFCPNIKLEYSVNNGNDWSVITNSIVNSGSFDWKIPNIISSRCLMRLSNANTGEALDTSDNTFSIVNGTIRITSPNGGESWIGDAVHDITWEGNGVIGTVKLDYTTDGTTWNTIATGEANDGIYNWTIPDENSSTCKLRVTSELNPEVFDESNYDFTIEPTPKITLTSPNGTEHWIVGTVEAITWTSVNLQNGVDIEYSIDNGTSWNIIATNTSDDGTHNWTIPDEIGNSVLIRISENGDKIPSDSSDAVFSIMTPIITLTSPNGGEEWFKGTIHSITWTSVGTVGDVKIEYTLGSGWNPITLSTTNDGSYSWTLPDTESYTCKVRISDVSNSLIQDESDAEFDITTSPALTLTSPNGSETWTEGTIEEITWTKAGKVGKVKIEYTVDGVIWKTVVDSAENNGSYDWTIPRDPTTTAMVRISDIINSSVSDLSDANFTLRIAPKIDITSPVGGEEWEVGTSQEISWLTEGIVGNVRIEYSADSGSTWNIIVASTLSSSSYNWIIPNDVSTNVFVRVMQLGSLIPADTSTEVLEIFEPSITVLTPNGGECFISGDLCDINWSSRGIVGDVKIEYTRDNSTWNDIITSTENDGSYNWTIPDYVTTLAKVKISEINRPVVLDESDGLFSIEKCVALTEVEEENLDIKNISIVPRIASKGESVSILIPKRVYKKGKILIFDHNGDILESMAFSNLTSSKRFIWDLKNESGVYVTSGTYLVVVQGTDNQGNLIMSKLFFGVKE